jgi:hypothetical protein
LIEFLIEPDIVTFDISDGAKKYSFTINTAGFAEAYARL